MAKKQETAAMAIFYEKQGMTLQEIADKYGISRQAVSQRLGRIGVKHSVRPPKCARIEKDTLEDLYTKKRLAVKKIGELLGESFNLIFDALTYYKIPKRASRIYNGKHINLLRTLEIGETKEIRCASSYPACTLHKSAKFAKMKITVRKLDNRGLFRVTRLS